MPQAREQREPTRGKLRQNGSKPLATSKLFAEGDTAVHAIRVSFLFRGAPSAVRVTSGFTEDAQN